MDQNWKRKSLIIGTVIGAAAGAASAFLLIKRAESEHQTPKLSSGEGIQVGLALLGLMRLISGFGSD